MAVLFINRKPNNAKQIRIETDFIKKNVCLVSGQLYAITTRYTAIIDRSIDRSVGLCAALHFAPNFSARHIFSTIGRPNNPK